VFVDSSTQDTIVTMYGGNISNNHSNYQGGVISSWIEKGTLLNTVVYLKGGIVKIILQQYMRLILQLVGVDKS